MKKKKLTPLPHRRHTNDDMILVIKEALKPSKSATYKIGLRMVGNSRT